MRTTNTLLTALRLAPLAALPTADTLPDPGPLRGQLPDNGGLTKHWLVSYRAPSHAEFSVLTFAGTACTVDHDGCISPLAIWP